MAKRIFTNSGASTIGTAMDASQTTCVLASGASFPTFVAGDELSIRCENEYMIATAKSSNTLTVTRAAYGSTGATHAVGAIVFACLTEEDLRRIARQSKNGTLAAARREINFINGHGVDVTLTDDGTNDKVDVQPALVPLIVTPAPSGAPAAGSSHLRFCSADSKLYMWNGSAWVSTAALT